MMETYLHGSGSPNGAAEAIFSYAETGMIGIVSAFRGYLSEEENNARTDELCRLILSNGSDHAEITGAFRKDDGEIVHERTLIVIHDKKPEKQALIQFRALMTGYAARFQQDAVFILYADPDISPEHKNSSTAYPFTMIGGSWERKSDYEWGTEGTVSRNEYTILRKFSHITPEEAFSAYSETIKGGTYSIPAPGAISVYRKSALRLQAKKCSGYAARDAIERNRKKLLALTE